MFTIDFTSQDVLGQEANKRVPCFSDAAGNPYLQPPKPTYTFPRFQTKDLIWALSYELSIRQDHDPGRGVMLVGPRGCGKTTHVQEVTRRLGIPLAQVSCNANLKVADMLQNKGTAPTFRRSTDANGNAVSEPVGITVYERDGILVTAMRDGFPILLDEGDKLDPCEADKLKDLIESRQITIEETGEVIRAARGFMIFMTMNSNGCGDMSGEYITSLVQDQAFMDRFDMVEYGYGDEDEEKAILAAALPDADPGLITTCVAVMFAINAAYNGNGKTRPLSPLSRRALHAWARQIPAYTGLAPEGLDPFAHTLHKVYVSKLPREQQHGVMEAAKILFNSGVSQ